MKQVDREALKEWESLKESIYNDTPIDESMSAADIEKHRLWLEAPGNEEEWERFFFPKYAKYPSAPFQAKARKRTLYNPEWYEVLSWSRELAKSVKTMMAVLRLVLTGEKSTVILASATQKAAARLLAPYRANLESNRRIIQYYGEQASAGECPNSNSRPEAARCSSEPAPAMRRVAPATKPYARTSCCSMTSTPTRSA